VQFTSTATCTDTIGTCTAGTTCLRRCCFCTTTSEFIIIIIFSTNMPADVLGPASLHVVVVAFAWLSTDVQPLLCSNSWHRGSNSPALLQRLRWDNVQKLGYASVRHWGYTNWCAIDIATIATM
jgi:hypothetical protein